MMSRQWGSERGGSRGIGLVALALCMAVGGIWYLSAGGESETVEPAPAEESVSVQTVSGAMPPAVTPVQGGGVAPANAVVDPRFAKLNSPDSLVRIDTLRALGASGDTGAIPSILKVDYSDDPYVATAAIEALGDLGARLPAGQQKDELANELAARLAVEKGRTHARESLGNMVLLLEAIERVGSQAPVETLAQELTDGIEDPVIRDTIVATLGKLGATDAIPAIESHLERLEKTQLTGDENHDLPVREARKLARNVLAQLQERDAQ